MKPTMINAKDVPAVYGIKAGTVLNLHKRRLIPFSRPIRGTILFRVDVIEEWIKAGRVETVAQMARRAIR